MLPLLESGSSLSGRPLSTCPRPTIGGRRMLQWWKDQDIVMTEKWWRGYWISCHDHGLHLIESCLNLIFFDTAMSSSLYHIIVATTSLHWHHTTACMWHPHYFHVPKQSRYEACKSNYEAGRSNPSQDLGGVTNSELTARIVKALEDFFYSLWGSIAKRYNQSRYR